MTPFALIKTRWTLHPGLCALALLASGATVSGMSEPDHPAALDAAIIRQARLHGVPEKLVRRIVMRESKYNAKAHNRAFWGLMQISYPTAKSMGFKGKPADLLDPFVNLTYAVPYLANAFIIAGKEEDAAVRLYASGYYQTAKSKGLLGDLRTAESDPVRLDPPNLIVATATPIANLAAAVVNAPNARQIVEASAAAQADVAQSPSNPAPQNQAQGVPGMPGQAMLPDQKQASGHGGGSDREPAVMMSRSRDGLTPPKKWTKDGGVTVIERGDQQAETIAAYQHGNRPPEVTEEPLATKKTARTKAPKLLVYALLDPPGSNQARPPQPAFALFSGFQASVPEVPQQPAGLPPGVAPPGPPAPGAAMTNVPAVIPVQAKSPKAAVIKAVAAHASVKSTVKVAGATGTTIVAKAPSKALTASQKAAPKAAVAKQKPGSSPVPLHGAGTPMPASSKTADAAASSQAYDTAIRSTFNK